MNFNIVFYVILICTIFCKQYNSIIIDNATSTYDSTVHDFDAYDYPKRIQTFHVRRDHYTNEIVSRGRLERIGGLEHKSAPISLSLFRKELQCATHEPTLNGRRGIINLLELVKPTNEMLELMCAWVENRCQPWTVCREVVKRFKHNPPTDLGMMNSDLRIEVAHVNLVRIMNGTVYVDWPWGSRRFSGVRNPHFSMTMMLFQVLGHISDMRDSAFFLGAEQPFLPSKFPFPAFSNSPSAFHGDIPWPWFESTEMEWRSYQYILEHNPEILKNTSDSNNAYSDKIIKQKPWEERYSKAVYYGEYINIRHLIFDLAIIHPDLIEAKWKCGACYVEPWNPLSKEYGKPLNNTITTEIPGNLSKIGFVEALWPIYISNPEPYHPGDFKYTVVLLGIDGKASSGRLAYLLAHSGTVVLLQDSIFEYHFSSHLKPWIHYVPLTSTGADIIDKIKWLKTHDNLARKIAKNAENFGKSYLRLEDYYCYIATALDTIANLEVGSDILTPSKPYLIPH